MIPIGQYLPFSSFIHKLDPRTKLLGLITLGVLTFIISNYSQILILSIFLLIVALLSKLPFIYILKGLKGFFPFFILTIFTHLYFTSDGTMVFGLNKGIFISLQLLILTLSGIILSLTTPPLHLVYGLKYLFAPLKFLRIPVEEFSLILVMAIIFIPTLILEGERLIKAQKARGIEFKTWPLKKRIKNSISIIIPLFLNTLRRADNMALIMEIRCFRGIEGRRFIKQLHFKKNDFVALFALGLLVFSIL